MSQQELADIEDVIAGDVADDFIQKDRVKDRNIKKRPKKVKKVEEEPKQEELQEPEDDDEIKFDMPVNNQVPGTQNVYVKTFGCSHNISDSEFMMGQLAEYGYNLCSDPKDAHLILVNSCTVKNPSQDAFMTIVKTYKHKKKPIVVAGCVPQGDRNIPGLEDVSVIGISQIDRVVEVVEETLKGNKVRLYGKKTLPSLDLPKIRKNNLIEIIPINTGCLGSCTYCKTKHARGKLGSYQPEAIVNRVKTVCEEGVKEIWLTSEDTGAYGRDIGTDISQLLRLIVEVLPNDVMLRVGMTNPPYILEHLQNMSTILRHPRVFSFLHIPVQAANNTVLENMNREYTCEEFEQVCDYLLKNVPNMTIATDIICGFPGETNAQFDDTLKLVDKYKFPILNISQFYPRPGTAAMKMKKVPSQDVKMRSKKITELFDTFKRWDHLLGTTQRIWINDKEDKKGVLQLVGHTKQYAKVMLPFEEELLGKSVIIKVTKVLTWHIEGEIIDRNPEPEVASADFFKDYVQLSVSQTEQKVKKILKQQEEEEQEMLNKQKAKSDQFLSGQDEQPKKSFLKEYGFIIIAIYLILCGLLKMQLN
ncbi:MiaB-like tRNA modifying enzyme, archaeal-type family protein (macronuclear) [Tetrahymena thermophila SB210]|uniref:Threonylcarbamoyladenosine tRNA methylthiotransferase n=1 Tax=Tetrahymena thermophila (strain SB210) TaxID=312017 RepID=I7M274_TETTS|nr:MiaB-like tRNA modifying enzyme, archaeal-type family protein [Tetrahymena thermophila SB210]EAR99465.2 MiaB-like tRNA modifying enzyme, archaeal-type family protein [Tetrahymena thermophila SB210]|eukprot:XP_001019710.2 MiaB-like tRNA modifying enzyme, archaeal-type family protein [Tetrahymena thermophila SB210]